MIGRPFNFSCTFFTAMTVPILKYQFYKSNIL